MPTFLTTKKIKQESFDDYFCGPTKGVEIDDLKLNALKQDLKYITLDPCSPYYNSLNFAQRNPVKSKRDQFKLFIFNLQDGRLYHDFIKEHSPDLIILDVHYMPLVMPFTYYGVSVLLASTKINMDKEEELPPVNSPLAPVDNHANRSEIEETWKKELIQKEKAFGKYFDFLEDISDKYDFDFERYFYREKAIVPCGFRFRNRFLGPGI